MKKKDYILMYTEIRAPGGIENFSVSSFLMQLLDKLGAGGHSLSASLIQHPVYFNSLKSSKVISLLVPITVSISHFNLKQ